MRAPSARSVATVLVRPAHRAVRALRAVRVIRAVAPGQSAPSLNKVARVGVEYACEPLDDFGDVLDHAKSRCRYSLLLLVLVLVLV